MSVWKTLHDLALLHDIACKCFVVLDPACSSTIGTEILCRLLLCLLESLCITETYCDCWSAGHTDTLQANDYIRIT